MLFCSYLRIRTGCKSGLLGGSVIEMSTEHVGNELG